MEGPVRKERGVMPTSPCCIQERKSFPKVDRGSVGEGTIRVKKKTHARSVERGFCKKEEGLPMEINLTYHCCSWREKKHNGGGKGRGKRITLSGHWEEAE